MLGDTAVAVHPEDERYRHSDRQAACACRSTDRLIPIIADEYVDRGVRLRLREGHAGTRLQRLRGRPPARSADHQYLGRRTRDAQRRSVPPSTRSRSLRGAQARRRDARSAGAARENRATHAHGAARRSQRRGARAVAHRPVVREDRPLAAPAIAAVEDGRTRFVPENWAKTYFQWMRNIQDWCISRQLWWGHRIPAWYDAAGDIFVARNADRRARAGRTASAATCSCAQDDDVLDTWFSSALWPFSTLGWPEQTPELRLSIRPACS